MQSSLSGGSTQQLVSLFSMLFPTTSLYVFCVPVFMLRELPETIIWDLWDYEFSNFYGHSSIYA